ncbi:hypothetical protein SAY87_021924 [Trapa incisa]|uniref:Uncharacterized protein n=1 Tax=Trapa incisa TaxID=236973 RepID=A0AAN7JSD0_9MYRT|nr:hypothetical protein SAY87_021924 [Trapa incisa]
MKPKGQKLQSVFFTAAVITIILCVAGGAHAQNQTQTTTDPDEAKLDFRNFCRKVYAIGVTGPIPDELWTLIYLFDLNLGQNVLTGSLSPSIGNLTRMQYL